MPRTTSLRPALLAQEVAGEGGGLEVRERCDSKGEACSGNIELPQTTVKAQQARPGRRLNLI